MLSEARVLYTDNDDGSAEFTVSTEEEDFKFSASAENTAAVVQYEETLSWRGKIRVSEPRQSVFRTLMTSDKMTAFMEEYGLLSVKREKHQ